MHVAVVGQGYIGLPLAVSAVRAGHDILAVESDLERLARLQSGDSYIPDVSSESLTSALTTGRFRPVLDIRPGCHADAYIVAVPTPATEDRQPDLRLLDRALGAVGHAMDSGALVVVESTVYPGAMREHVRPLLERVSGKALGAGFYLAYSPERVDPGRKGIELEEIPKLVSGLCSESALLARKFYESIFDRVHAVSSCEVAEFAKLLENTFRYVNIAFANELARAAHVAAVDFREVMAAAATKPYGFMPFHHGPGVGGHCLPNNVAYLSHCLRDLGRPSSILSAARAVNEAAPGYVADRLADALARRGQALDGASVVIIGLAYKAGVADSRESPAVPVIELLRHRGARVSVADPLADAEIGRLGLTPAWPVADACRAADAVVIVTDQDGIDYDAIAREAALVLDCRGRVGHSAAEQL
jgi:UDP-N-acetyl-D-glucosamine dehydrogenase